MAQPQHGIVPLLTCPQPLQLLRSASSIATGGARVKWGLSPAAAPTHAPPAARRPAGPGVAGFGAVRGRCHLDVVSVLLLILGLVLGAACAFALARPNRGRMRDELTAISADVLTQTGDSLAQRLADQRRAEQERASGEMARRAEEFKGLVQPVQEKLGRMESEIGRLERE